MSWTRYLLNDFFTAREFDKIDAERLRERQAARRRSSEERNRTAALEDDIGMLTLATRTLAEILVRKGIVTTEEMAEITVEIDRLDGSEDGKFDAGRVPEPE